MSGHDIIPTTPSSVSSGSMPTFGVTHSNNPVVAMQSNYSNNNMNNNNHQVVFDARALSQDQAHVRVGGFQGQLPGHLDFNSFDVAGGSSIVPAAPIPPRDEPTHGHVGDVDEETMPIEGTSSGSGGGGGGASEQGQGQGQGGAAARPTPRTIREMLQEGIPIPDQTGPRRGRITLPVEKPKYY
ncbi:hypothetical protein BG004_002704 [Podila humilis]|nr:hypothetical protein BG004_002704 [Podila humilis]